MFATVALLIEVVGLAPDNSHPSGIIFLAAFYNICAIFCFAAGVVAPVREAAAEASGRDVGEHRRLGVGAEQGERAEERTGWVQWKLYTLYVHKTWSYF
jgi:hypothetical protein